jgi:hypothetical protein
MHAIVRVYLKAKSKLLSSRPVETLITVQGTPARAQRTALGTVAVVREARIVGPEAPPPSATHIT